MDGFLIAKAVTDTYPRLEPTYEFDMVGAHVVLMNARALHTVFKESLFTAGGRMIEIHFFYLWLFLSINPNLLYKL